MSAVFLVAWSRKHGDRVARHWRWSVHRLRPLSATVVPVTGWQSAEDRHHAGGNCVALVTVTRRRYAARPPRTAPRGFGGTSRANHARLFAPKPRSEVQPFDNELSGAAQFA